MQETDLGDDKTEVIAIIKNCDTLRLIKKLLDSFDDLQSKPQFDDIAFNKDYSIWAQSLMYDKEQKALAPLHDYRMGKLMEDIQKKESNQAESLDQINNLNLNVTELKARIIALEAEVLT